jgi:hypothetical protein
VPKSYQKPTQINSFSSISKLEQNKKAVEEETYDKEQQ